MSGQSRQISAFPVRLQEQVMCAAQRCETAFEPLHEIFGRSGATLRLVGYRLHYR
jgi:hypothetical protein